MIHKKCTTSDKLGRHMNTPPADPSVSRPPRLLDQLRNRIRLNHHRLRSGHAYARWVKRYTYFHGRRHPAERRLREVVRRVQ
jgi:hypothetical protein